MPFLHLLGISIGLGMDAFAVSVASGIKLKELHIVHSFRMALFFGLFQAVMPLIGWYLGVKVVNIIKSYDHWVAFILLAGIGIRMIHESFKLEGDKKRINPADIHVLLLLSFATSIDAFAVGFTFAIFNIDILMPVILIGVITFLMSLGGVYLGQKFGGWLQKYMEITGGVILILIGLKILVEHLLSG
ncbi:manganese efflux pump [bacterium]|nr:manganese efflux pump [bacterium]